MRKQLIIVCMVLMALPTLYSCKKDFDKLNTDPINALGTTADKLLAPALVNTITAGMIRNRSFTNELMQVTVTISDGDNTVFRYAFKNNQSDYLWNNWFLQLTNFKQVDSLAHGYGKDSTINYSYQGIGKVCKAWVYANLTDTYGDIPYFHALQGDSDLLHPSVMPSFDRQQDIYADLQNQLEEANMLLSKGDTIVGKSDPIYKGDVTKWRKFCNSLYLRLLLRISGKAEVQQQCIAKIKQIVENPAQYPIFQSNADCARLLWTGSDNTTDPYTNPYVTAVRTSDFRSPSVCSFFIDKLVAWSDPRYVSGTPYGSGTYGRWGISQASGGGWYGVESGYLPGHGDPRGCYFQSNDYDNTTADNTWSLQQNQYTGIIMQYAEVQFILAEAAAKGWITGNTKTFWQQGIASAINYWVPNFNESISNANFTTHLNNLNQASEFWNDNLPLDDKMELIHVQKYYALFLTDLQQWFEYRRTGHPILPKGAGLANGGVMPARLVYPVYVQAANPTNYSNAVAVQGPDEIYTRVWWQRP
ncbi:MULTISPECIES: SusD/RagB family nutrient-binding outer membrane lipoprotein [Niastella]|uniref:SusD/RagB family nutrient-binding outer membrane lipoprotein n=1 Tax=Niastella soli TaxID=2821487 RepID=A0ABS3Z7F1_9BACT|nr:SusD/RagB family nutrient-binding outer membrane lipoprotein [Niastella soli]MBO9205391.1 SusD/RagB family nutrient-binding outer membrane lipoprotein [Niastella soli]